MNQHTRIIGYHALGEILGSPYEARYDINVPPFDTWMENIQSATSEEWNSRLSATTLDRTVGKTGDDVYFMLGLAKHLMSHSIVDSHSLCDTLEEEVTKNEGWGLGSASYLWYQECLKKTPYEKRASARGMAGASPVTRAIVLPLKNNDISWIIKNNELQTQVTHQDKQCAAYGLATALTLRSIIRKNTLSPYFRRETLDIVSTLYDHEQETIKQFFMNGNDWDKQIDWIQRLGVGSCEDPYPWIVEQKKRNPQKHPFLGGYAPATFFLSLTLAFKHEGNIFKALHEINSLGGDTDTTGALCGSFCAALSECTLADEILTNIDKWYEIEKITL